jgi:hypothetical protein
MVKPSGTSYLLCFASTPSTEIRRGAFWLTGPHRGPDPTLPSGAQNGAQLRLSATAECLRRSILHNLSDATVRVERPKLARLLVKPDL